jgi:hypothetical protein
MRRSRTAAACDGRTVPPQASSAPCAPASASRSPRGAARSRPLLLIEGTLETAFLIAMADLPNGLLLKRNNGELVQHIVGVESVDRSSARVGLVACRILPTASVRVVFHFAAGSRRALRRL